MRDFYSNYHAGREDAELRDLREQVERVERAERRVLRPDFTRGYTPPVRTAKDHEDDELMHGRIGASLRDRRPMSSRAFFALLVIVAVVVIVADFVGRAS